ncbi:MAG: dihydrofolate reductase family protein [Propionibacteriaceae bacterium]|nr:dihydrofolate reductase family protein [Micropruina sp.]HBY22966.1 deaminase [Propionibacteriaceae bacterium]
MARQVTATLFHSLDGVATDPNLWQFDAFDDGVMQVMIDSLARTDATLMGRKTYEMWAPYWPTATDPFGDFINPVVKHVASRTLTQDDLTWNNSHLIVGDLADFVRGLKETEGGDIAVEGSLSVIRQLFLGGVLDRLTLITHPVIAGAGEHLFTAETPTTQLALLESFSTDKGNVVSTYALRS